jgi:predicted nucleic acid-binding protein
MKVTATKRLVLDASVSAAWCFPDETTPLAEGLLDRLATGLEAVVPSIWPFEIANALLQAERLKRITQAQAAAELHQLMLLPITVEPVQTSRAFGMVLSLAREQNLTEYDAAYLELAIRESLPLATVDDGLRNAARDLGVALVTG